MRMMTIRQIRYGTLAAALAALGSAAAAAGGGTVVALGASNTYGQGVSRSQSFPAQLEAMLRRDGYRVHVINAGISGDTTGGMLGRLDRVVPRGTRVVILQPGGNDFRRGSGGERGGNIAAIEQQLSARGIRVVMIENGMFRGLPHQADRVHLTPEGYHALAERVLPQVVRALQ